MWRTLCFSGREKILPQQISAEHGHEHGSRQSDTPTAAVHDECRGVNGTDEDHRQVEQEGYQAAYRPSRRQCVSVSKPPKHLPRMDHPPGGRRELIGLASACN
jgi:hypothetical protein